MSTFDYFDSILCINLDRRPDRWEQAQAELKKCDLASRCQRVSGFDHPTNGNHGCTSSHRVLWQRIGAGELGDRVLVFEDDFKLLTHEDLVGARYAARSDTMRIFSEPTCEKPSDAQWLDCRLRTMLADVPAQWDVLYLGGGYATAPMSRVGKYVIRNAGMLTTHSYAITPPLAKALTETLGQDPLEGYPGPVDSVLCGFAKDFVFLTLSPRLFIQRPATKSDLTGETGGFPFSMTDPVHESMV